MKRSKKVAVEWGKLRAEARKRFGVERFRVGQRELITAALAGDNALGILPTGAGKSLCYQLPALFLPQPVVVVSPLISLMQDQQDKAQDAEIGVSKLNSTLTRSEETDTLDDITAGAPDLVYVTPEQLESEERLEALAASGVSLLVVDEAHCVTQWGHDFRPAYLGIRRAIERLGRPPVLALTATAPPEVARDILEQLGIERALLVTDAVERENLFFEVRRTVNEDAKKSELAALLAEPGCVIVYAATIREADAVWSWLTERGIRAGRYHGGLKTAERTAAQQSFMADEYQVMVATKAFGMGIDKPDIRAVVHWNFPDSLESYYQEAGRAGRDGLPARAVLLYRLEDRRVQSYFLGGKYPSEAAVRSVCEAMERAGGAVSAAELAELAGIGERRVKVILNLLENEGVVERPGSTYTLAADYISPDMVGHFVTEYAERLGSDRERLETIIHYAETTNCRTRFIREYFGEDAGPECGHCDNCRDRPAERLVSMPPPRPDQEVQLPVPPHKHEAPAAALAAGLAVGTKVSHATFGEGEVRQIEGDNVVVSFAVRGRKRPVMKTVRASYLHAVAS